MILVTLTCSPQSAGWIIRHSQLVRGQLRLAPRFALRQTKELAEQPWRNPRPAPQLEEIRQGVPAKNFVPQVLRSWWPALLWASLIFSMSSDTFSSNHTASILYPMLHWMRPSLTFKQFDVIHYFIRKSAHFTEYFVFCVFLFRGVRGGRAGWRWPRSQLRSAIRRSMKSTSHL
jgi:hypothetical protein